MFSKRVCTGFLNRAIPEICKNKKKIMTKPQKGSSYLSILYLTITVLF